jgi:ABC-type lipoprotein export system ATPase subunit
MSVTTSPTTGLLGCQGVSVFYGVGDARVHALRAVDLSIDSSERVALWGRSGSGKTTLLHALGGLVVPNEGHVSFKGQELSGVDAAARGQARARGIAYIFQGANLLPHFTAYENVAFASHAATKGNRSDARPDYSPEELLELVGLAAKLDALPAELSGGEAQRVAIARALAQGPELLLCDEPTGHLDSDTAIRVLDLIDTLRGELSFALVTATHDVDVAARMSRVIELTDGSIVTETRP